MFVVRVIVGEYARGKPTMVRPPPKDERKPYGELYDSCVDNVEDPNIFVIFAQEQVYPEYLIEYWMLGLYQIIPRYLVFIIVIISPLSLLTFPWWLEAIVQSKTVQMFYSIKYLNIRFGYNSTDFNHLGAEEILTKVSSRMLENFWRNLNIL